ncbi:MAG: hypothetical protein ACOXZH_02435 [Bacteroidales bacterium]|mgnify:FL=1|jgi:gliding motility-associated lipoprotein GldH|nr:gliding motility lipoprotein GldH [Bacteroidales bacterium]
MKKHIILFLVITLSFIACDNKKVIYEQTIYFADAQWNRFSILEFTPEIKNIKKDYDFIVSVQFKEGYQHNTLPINTVLIYPNGQKNINRHVFLIQNEHGYLGNVKDDSRYIEAVIFSKKHFDEKGTYIFTVQQLTQYYDLGNIKAIGCKVIRSNSKNK